MISVLIGVLLAQVIASKNNGFKYLLTFSGAFLFSLLFVEMLPHCYHELGMKAGFYILAGFLLQLILDYLITGIEHGDSHIYGTNKLGLVLASLGLFIHAFVEGMALSDPDTLALVYGIALHKIPIAMIIYTLLKSMDLSVSKITFLMLIFALISPLGYLAVEQLHISHHSMIKILCLVIGLFLHVSTTVIFDTSNQHRFDLKKFVSILVGLAVGSMTIYMTHGTLQHHH